VIELEFSREEWEMIEDPDPEANKLWYEILTARNPSLNWKAQLNMERCAWGDRQIIFHGMGHQGAVILAPIGPICIVKN
jgi:hypothetical protein